jgi:hypothetical protein
VLWKRLFAAWDFVAAAVAPRVALGARHVAGMKAVGYTCGSPSIPFLIGTRSSSELPGGRDDVDVIAVVTVTVQGHPV